MTGATTAPVNAALMAMPTRARPTPAAKAGSCLSQSYDIGINLLNEICTFLRIHCPRHSILVMDRIVHVALVLEEISRIVQAEMRRCLDVTPADSHDDEADDEADERLCSCSRNTPWDERSGVRIAPGNLATK